MPYIHISTEILSTDRKVQFYCDSCVLLLLLLFFFSLLSVLNKIRDTAVNLGKCDFTFPRGHVVPDPVSASTEENARISKTLLKSSMTQITAVAGLNNRCSPYADCIKLLCEYNISEILSIQIIIL